MFGKVAGVASEEVIVDLLKVKCLPVLLYGLEACPISNKQFNSLDFVLKGCFRKIFRTRSAEVVQNCMLIFNCMSMQECVAKRKCKFLANYVKSDNILCYVCQNTATHELNMLGKRWLFHSSLQYLRLHLFIFCLYIYIFSLLTLTSIFCICHALVNKVVCVCVEFLLPAVWYDHDIDFARRLHPAVWYMAVES